MATHKPLKFLVMQVLLLFLVACKAKEARQPSISPLKSPMPYKAVYLVQNQGQL